MTGARHTLAFAASTLPMLVMIACSSGGQTSPPSPTPVQASPTQSLPPNPFQSSPTSPGPIPAMTQTHTSSFLRYQMSYPAGWTLYSEATKRWVFGGEGDEFGDRTVDEFHAPGPAAFAVSSQEIPPGMTLRQWVRAYMGPGPSANPTCWPPPASWETTDIAGHTAKVHGGSVSCNFREAVTIVGGRAYVFSGLANRKRCCDYFDPGLFDAFLATIRFPGAAAVTPSASSS